MKQFRNVCIVQTMMLRGTHFNKRIDNTTDAEVEALIEAYRQISPRRIQLYSIDRETPCETLQVVPRAELMQIAERIHRATGIEVQVN